jgi:hypothetical protein
VELKRTTNLTNTILGLPVNKQSVKLRIGALAENEYLSQPGDPIICKIDVLNKPQPMMLELSNYTGALHVYVSSEHIEPSEADNQMQIHNVRP